MSVAYYKEDMAWFIKEIEDGNKDQSQSSDYDKEYPYKVDLVDQFQGHDEYGYDPVRNYKTLEEAIRVARRITEEAILRVGSVYEWHGMSDAGLVYHNLALVWSGVEEYTATGGSDEALKALQFATNAHKVQLRKGTKRPYIFHPIGVAENLLNRNCTNKLVSAAFLHDTLEDTQVTYEDLEREFGLYIAEIVKGLSEPDRKLSWKERKAHTIQHLKEAAPDVCLVSCSDKLDNVRAIMRDSNNPMDDIWQRFNASKEEQAWYYRSLAAVFKERGTDGILKDMSLDFCRMVEQVFGK